MVYFSNVYNNKKIICPTPKTIPITWVCYQILHLCIFNNSHISIFVLEN